jgi:hypothetical protein
VVIAASRRPVAGGGEVAARPFAERAGLIVGEVELCPVALCLFEVIAEELVALDQCG